MIERDRDLRYDQAKNYKQLLYRVILTYRIYNNVSRRNSEKLHRGQGYYFDIY